MSESSNLRDLLERTGAGASSGQGSSRNRPGAPSGLNIGGGLPPQFLLDEKEDRGPRRAAIIIAVLLHVGFFIAKLPEMIEPPRQVGPRAIAFQTKQVRFKPPPPRAQQEIPKKRTPKKTIPIPDPTPEEPEPIRELEDLDLSEVDLPEGEAVFGIPEGPTGTGSSVSGAMQISGNIAPPVKIHSVRPLYTEEARQARIQGVVILQAVIDTDGKVVNVKILKGLPMGLDQTAIDAVTQWRYKPAVLEGEPVPVYYNITISFHLQ